MTATYKDVNDIFSRNFGSENLYKRNYCNNLLYTTGILDFAKTLDAHWLIDNIISYMPEVLKLMKQKKSSSLLLKLQ